jgi:hypothetical protein
MPSGAVEALATKLTEISANAGGDKEDVHQIADFYDEVLDGFG